MSVKTTLGGLKVMIVRIWEEKNRQQGNKAI